MLAGKLCRVSEFCWDNWTVVVCALGVVVGLTGKGHGAVET